MYWKLYFGIEKSPPRRYLKPSIHFRADKCVPSQRQVVGPMDQSAQDRKRIGSFFAQHRREQGWTLEQVSQKCGVSVPTISKVEKRGQISFDTLLRMIDGLDLDISDVLTAKQQPPAPGGRFTVTRANEADFFTSEQSNYFMHAAQIRGKQMIALIMHLKTDDPGPAELWSSHEGEEFVIVLEGEVVMHSEFYVPLALNKGDSVYFDSSMRHIFVSANQEQSTILSMCTGRGIKHIDKVAPNAIRGGNQLAAGPNT